MAVVGGGPLNQVEEIRSLMAAGLEDMVVDLTLKTISDNQLRDLYDGATALVYLSLDEGFGLPVLEALASGGNVVATDLPVFREVSIDRGWTEENIRFVNPASPRDIWSAIHYFIKTGEIKQNIGIDSDNGEGDRTKKRNTQISLQKSSSSSWKNLAEVLIN